MTSIFRAPGKTLDWTNDTGSDVAVDEVVVVNGLIGIAAVAIADTETGVLHIEGVFTVPKVSGAVITIGEPVIWDSSAGEFDDSAATAATGDIENAGTAMETKGASTTTVEVKLKGFSLPVTA